MTNEPEYSSYSISELKDVIKNIDRDNFPERAIAAQDALERKQLGETIAPYTCDNVENEIESNVDTQVTLHWIWLIVILLASLFFLTQFIYGLVELSVSSKRGNVYSFDEAPRMFLFLMTIKGSLGLYGSYYAVKDIKKRVF